MKIALLMLLLVMSSISRAVAAEGYFTVKEEAVSTSEASVSLNPVAVVAEVWEQVQPGFYQLRAAFYSLVSFDFHAQKYGDVNEPYQRQKHFGGWVVDSRQSTCLNTRGQVLIRDSAVEVRLRPRGCTVEAGLWADPYSARDFTQASDIQIDHFVPLKNAYLAGAYKWGSAKRCLYANYMGNAFHLLSVFGRENSSKGDRSPEGYMPPNPSYQCQYLAQWLKIKLIWSLAVTSSEKEKILNLIQSNHCPADEMTYSAADLEQQRRFIADNMGLCH